MKKLLSILSIMTVVLLASCASEQSKKMSEYSDELSKAVESKDFSRADQLVAWFETQKADITCDYAVDLCAGLIAESKIKAQSGDVPGSIEAAKKAIAFYDIANKLDPEKVKQLAEGDFKSLRLIETVAGFKQGLESLENAQQISVNEEAYAPVDVPAQADGEQAPQEAAEAEQ